MSRAIILLMDSFGIGGAPDAAAFGDEGANTLGHIASAYKGLNIPNLTRLGLKEAAREASGVSPDINDTGAQINLPSKFGHMKEISKDKDTVSGHWEMAGLPNIKGWGHFPPAYPSFPDSLIKTICQEGGIEGILGNKAASGTVIIQELGEEHI
ncbi:MAG: phosphopentomutase, partial [Alphaproteobacteria bacterium]